MLFSGTTRPLRHLAAFSLIEIVIALSVLGTMAAGCYIGFNAINTYAVSSRLYSEAQTAAQNQIDLVLSKSPFDVNAAYISGSFNPNLSKIPLELMTTSELDALATTVSFPAIAPTSIPAASTYYPAFYPYYRTGSGQPALKQAFVYQDPVSGKVLVTGTLTTSVQDSGLTMNFVNATATNLNIRKATVTVSYTFRNRNYNVSMDTMRTADQ
jgi:type II secretory pathway pseudopilin PulG